MHIVILVTAQDEAQANTIAEKLVEEKLVACANIVPGIQSIFRWQGKTDRAQEVLLVLKSRRRHFPSIVKTVKALHGYDVPEVIALPIVEGNKDYLNWLTEST
ncbi:MAG: cation tolerance protein CutA [Omnitrophica WOR_2 bacterium RIFCSPHIGHO2_01_FULL_52_10]|nr:MAG: cation tolerance protein CutA [Omnitrophica WOR_2 bacterium RIFCSPHIGHO2_01_FULL_52_10]